MEIIHLELAMVDIAHMLTSSIQILQSIWSKWCCSSRNNLILVDSIWISMKYIIYAMVTAIISPILIYHYQDIASMTTCHIFLLTGIYRKILYRLMLYIMGIQEIWHSLTCILWMDIYSRSKSTPNYQHSLMRGHLLYQEVHLLGLGYIAHKYLSIYQLAGSSWAIQLLQFIISKCLVCHTQGQIYVGHISQVMLSYVKDGMN